VAPFTLLVPVAGIAAAWLWLGEAPGALELAGAALVLGGLALTVGLARGYATARRRRSGFPRSALTTD
jgi:O-acetylserine/cysteine efflux transporter